MGLKAVESRFSDMVTKNDNLLDSNKALNRMVTIRDAEIKNLQQELKALESENRKLKEKTSHDQDATKGAKKRKSSEEESSEEESSADYSIIRNLPSKRARPNLNGFGRFKDGNDDFCWICHKHLKDLCPTSVSKLFCCDICPRVYHQDCIDVKIPTEGKFSCPECTKIQKAENPATKSPLFNDVTKTGEYWTVLYFQTFFPLFS